MRRFLLLLIVPIFSSQLYSQYNPTALRYLKTGYMIPMRDGAKLYTVVLTPNVNRGPYPILITRTPYGADYGLPDGDGAFSFTQGFQFANMANDGYIFVLQDIRGKFKSGGKMEIHTPLIHRNDRNAVDESTDTWDTIDWLIHNIQNNNGRAGIVGVSYPGWLALVGTVDHHPALKASSEQACMGDLFLGDDFHHNGAFRLSYGLEYTYEVESDPTTDSSFPFPEFDLFNWYLNLGSLKHVNEKYFHGKIPTWNHFVKHPNYDSFWLRNSPLSYIHSSEIPQLHVGGFYDQEDLNGPQLMYKHQENSDSNHYNHIVLGPWFHGQWAVRKGDSLGKISFGSNTGDAFRELQKKWFDYYLKDIGDGKFEEAYIFQTGSNVWKTYPTWPSANVEIKSLYSNAGNKASFSRPVADGSVSYVSDPKKPVPYRLPPIEETYGDGSRWRPWQVEDQRFVTTRPDVISFSSDTLTSEITVTGNITAHLFASTTGTDADWVVKLIDVYPDYDTSSYTMSGYQLPVAMEVFRGRFRKSFSAPESLIPGKPEEFTFGLHQIDHVFKKGHRLMIQIQSSWFPVIDLNPQKYVPNIFEANDSDFIKATQTIYFSPKFSTRIDLPVAK